MAFEEFKGKKFTAVTSSVKLKNKEIYRKIPAILRLGKKNRSQGGFFDYEKLLKFVDKTKNSSFYDDDAVVVMQSSESLETSVLITASLFQPMMYEFMESQLPSSSYASISQSFQQITDGTAAMPFSEQYIGVLTAPFEVGSIGSGSEVIPPPTCSLNILESCGIAYDESGNPRSRKVTYFNSSSNFTNSHFFFNYRRSDNTTAKFGDTEQAAQTTALVNKGLSHLTRSFTSIFSSPKSANMFYYVQSSQIREFSVEMTSSLGTASFYALTSSFSGAADFGVTGGGITTASSFLGNSIETSSASHPKFYNEVDDSDGKWTYVVQKAVIEGEGENSLGEISDAEYNKGNNFAFTPQQLLVWYNTDYYCEDVRSASFYFTPYPENMHELDVGAKTKALVTGSIALNESAGTGELRTLYWLKHTYTSSFTASFGNHTRAQLRDRVGEANNLQLPYMNTHRIGVADSYFGRKQRGANASHLWKDKFLSKPADEGYYVHSGSFSIESKGQMSASVKSADAVIGGATQHSHTSSFFVMGVFKHPFLSISDSTVFNYTASQQRDSRINAQSWMNHHPIASCMFLKRHDDKVFLYQASASGQVVSESVG